MKKVVCTSKNSHSCMFHIKEGENVAKMFMNLSNKFSRILKDNPQDREKTKKISDDSKQLNQELKEVLEMCYETYDYCYDHKKQQSQNQSTSKVSDPFDDFYQSCWDALIEDKRKKCPNLEVDQSTQGGSGVTRLFDDGWDSSEYYMIDEGQAVKNVRNLFEKGNTSIQDGIEAIYEAGSWVYDD